MYPNAIFLFNKIALGYLNMLPLFLLCTLIAYYFHPNVTLLCLSYLHHLAEDSPRRLKQLTLRAMPKFQNKVALDYVKIDVDMDDGHGPSYRSYFGR